LDDSADIQQTSEEFPMTLTFQGESRLSEEELQYLRLAECEELAFYHTDVDASPGVQGWVDSFGCPSLSDRLYLIWLARACADVSIHGQVLTTYSGIYNVDREQSEGGRVRLIENELIASVFQETDSFLTIDLDPLNYPMNEELTFEEALKVVALGGTPMHPLKVAKEVVRRLAPMIRYDIVSEELEVRENPSRRIGEQNIHPQDINARKRQALNDVKSYSVKGRFPCEMYYHGGQLLFTAMPKLVCSYGDDCLYESGPKDGGMGGFNPYGNGQTELLGDMEYSITEVKLWIGKYEEQAASLKKKLEIISVDRASYQKAMSQNSEYQKEISELKTKLTGLSRTMADLTQSNELLKSELRTVREESELRRKFIEDLEEINSHHIENQSNSSNYATKFVPSSVPKEEQEIQISTDPKSRINLITMQKHMNRMETRFQLIVGTGNTPMHRAIASWAGYEAQADGHSKREAENAAAAIILAAYEESRNNTASVEPMEPPTPVVESPKVEPKRFVPARAEPGVFEKTGPKVIMPPIKKDDPLQTMLSSSCCDREQLDWIVAFVKMNPGKNNTEIKSNFSKVYPGHAGKLNFSLHYLFKQENKLTCVAQNNYNYWFAK